MFVANGQFNTLSRLAAFAIMCCMLGCGFIMAEPGRPAVLFHGYSPHPAYAARPLNELGIEIGRCERRALSATLGSNLYNVVVVSTATEDERAVLDEFMARGGGVLVFNPVCHPTEKDFDATCRWLDSMGARPRWEMLQDRDRSNIVSVTHGQLSWTGKVSPPVAEGVRGLLTVISRSTTGWEPPMSYDFSQDWTIVVRGADSMMTVTDPRNDPVLQPWLPKEPVASSPALMGIRQRGKGRIAVLPMRDYWLVRPPPNCPPAAAMLKYDDEKRPSDWLRLLANAIRWLAEPGIGAGLGGATTDPDILNPPVKPWEEPPVIDWTKHVKAMADEEDMPQHPGLCGARTSLSTGKGTVAEHAKAAHDAGMHFLVFLEDSLAMDAAGWERLVQECASASDDNFVAVPGLTYEDAQSNHLYAIGFNVLFFKPGMRLSDNRFDTVRRNRCETYFQYVNEMLGQKDLTGFWRHRENWVHWEDYKLYNSFPIVSFDNGAQVDDALNEYLHWQSMGGCQAVMALEIMNDPAMVAERARRGWRIVWNRNLRDLRDGKWHQGAWSFCGMGAQYITSGPEILVWRSPNNLAAPNGLWWRPDVWEYRIRFRAASEAGLKSVVLHDGDRRVLRRWLPKGEKRFEADLVLANAQQIGATLVVEDNNGGRAVSTAYWNRNLNMEEFFCSDRCNILGNARLRMKSNGAQYWTPVGFQANMGCTPSKGRMNIFVHPAVGLTPNSPTIPVDGQPPGLPPVAVDLNLGVPGEHSQLFTSPTTWMAGPEITVGEYGFRLAYDPAEQGAEVSPLGHRYEQPQEGSGNSWSSWHRLIPTRKVDGWARVYACNWLTEGFRIGWFQTSARLKEAVAVDGKGIRIGYTRGTVCRDGKRVSGEPNAVSEGPFSRGVYACMESEAGAVMVLGMSDNVSYRARGENLEFWYKVGPQELPATETIEYTLAFAGAAGGTTFEQMIAMARAFGVDVPGRPAYQAKMKRGRLLDTYLLLDMEADGGAVEVGIPRTAMPAFLTARVSKLNDRWSVHLLDRNRRAPNHRALPVREGTTFAQLDLNDANLDLFIGHPVVADMPEVVLNVAWLSEGKWRVEAHNPSDAAIEAHLKSSAGWTLFNFDQKVRLEPGTSMEWTVDESG